jgi:hypothetical protein
MLRRRGLPARFLFVFPHSNMGRRTVDATAIDKAIRDAYSARLRALLRIPLPLFDEASIELADDARAMWCAFASEIEPRLDPEHGDLACIADWAGKLAGATARIAGVLHAATVGGKHAARVRISGQTMENAIRLARYLVDHALVAFDVIEISDAEDDADAVVTWLRGRPDIEQFTPRDVQRSHPRRFRRAEQACEAMRVLVERDFLKFLDEEKYLALVNPRLHQA